MENQILTSVVGGIVVLLFFAGIKIIRPTHRGLIERLGKYRKFAMPGFHWIVPFIDRMYSVNTTEQMIDAQPQEIITNDNLNASVDAQVYFKVIESEEGVKSSQYNVNNYKIQIVNLARTTLRNIIGTLTLRSANSERGKINAELHKTLRDETESWGIVIVRTELKEIDPPKDVQETMNKVVKAENEKIAAVDYATAAETVADGVKRAKIKEADDRVSVGFPGYIKRGFIHTAPNLGTDLWKGVNLNKLLTDAFNKPVRIINDADLQGLGVVSEQGLEMVITLGTGFGTALLMDGHLLPHLELAHHPVSNGETYDNYVGNRALRDQGEKNWNERVQKVLQILKTVFNYDRLYIGGGNSARLNFKVDENVTIINNIAGIKGGARLWKLDDTLFMKSSKTSE